MPDVVTTSVEKTLTCAEWQPELYAARPSRLRLMKFKPTWELKSLRIRVHRNHAFEHIANIMDPWLATWNRRATWTYSDYDDSFSFDFETTDSVDAEIVWLDASGHLSRFGDTEFVAWLEIRLSTLRARSNAPIIVALIGGESSLIPTMFALVKRIAGVRFGDLSLIAAALGDRFIDERAAKLSGTTLSDTACVLAAREFACRWLPAMLMPRLKALAIDLDNTLFQGVVGEDGSDVTLTESHARLQQYLVDLRKDGLFLALVSRNEEEDVRKLFATRQDFPLKWEDFSATAISWGSKADALHQVASALRIGADSIACVDDNPGELAAVVAEFPTVTTIHAADDAALTQRAIEFTPGLFAWERTAADVVRINDLRADIERGRLISESMDPLAYLRSLSVRLLIEVSPRHQQQRLYELSQKTNQFNLNLSRVSEIDLAAEFDFAEQRVISFSLSDRLSDSGVIGMLCARRTNNTLIVHELAISCRALGRRLESLMIGEAIRAVLADLPAAQIEFAYRTGPRNAPARDWLKSVACSPLNVEGRVEVSLESLATSKYIPVDVQVIHYGI
jgi:FkbH-like protein